MSTISKYFKFEERNTSLATEIRAGFVTFFAMAYIVALNPLILGGADTIGHKLDENGTGTVAALTALIAGIMCILMGVISNTPLTMAAALGFNSVIAVSSTLKGARWQDLMGLIVIVGIIIFLLTISGVRKYIFLAIPQELRYAIGVGIGLFIALIGLWDSGAIRAGDGIPFHFEISSIPVLSFFLCLITIVILSIRKIKGAILISIIGWTIIGFILEAIFNFGSLSNKTGGWKSNIPKLEDNVFHLPDFSLFGQVDLFGGFIHIGIFPALMLVFSLVLSDFFDTMGTSVSVQAQAGLLDSEGNPINTQRIFIIDSLGAIFGGLGSVSSQQPYVESSAGVAEGGRTGFTSIVTGFLFLLATFFSPLVQYIPAEATTPALVFVGFLMLQNIVHIDLKDWEISIPAYLTIIGMPLFYSITSGLGIGFISFVLIKLFIGKIKEVHPILIVISILFIFYFI